MSRSVCRVIAIVVGLIIGSSAGPWIGLEGGPGVAHAGDNDLVLSRFGVLSDGQSAASGNNQLFRSLASELGVVMAPRLLSPSDTLGFSGFQFAGDLSFTTISNNQDYWRVRESSESPDGGAQHGGAVMPTVGMFVRKGIWLPLPSFEVGAGMVHLTSSSMFAAQGYAKFALHEGYHDLPIPSVAVRGAVSRVMGTSQLDLTVASVDVSMSKSFGLGGSINIEPYAGWNALIIVPRAEVLDPTPQIPEDDIQNFVFPDQDNITRNRFFLGFKVQYYIIAVLFEANIALAGTSVDDQEGTSEPCGNSGALRMCDSTDQAGAQQTFTIGLGVDF